MESNGIGYRNSSMGEHRLSSNKSISIANPTEWAMVGNDNTVAYDAGKTYTASAYVKTENLSANAAYIQISYYNSSGTYLSKVQSRKLGGTKDWTRLVVTATPEDAPAGAATVKVWVGLSAASGKAYYVRQKIILKGTAFTSSRFLPGQRQSMPILVVTIIFL